MINFFDTLLTALFSFFGSLLVVLFLISMVLIIQPWFWLAVIAITLILNI